MKVLGRDFYDRDTVTVARELLGKTLVRVLEGGGRLCCSIAETEAYVGPVDKACHAYQYRRTARTETLFARPGTAYVYFIYGMYHCLNAVTEPEGTPCAVLIRGAVPTENEETMALLRFRRTLGELTAYQRRNFLNGPGKLCRGLDLNRTHNGLDLTDPNGPLYVTEGPAPERILVGERIGIDYAEEAVHFPWRFWVPSEGAEAGTGGAGRAARTRRKSQI